MHGLPEACCSGATLLHMLRLSLTCCCFLYLILHTSHNLLVSCCVALGGQAE